MGSRKKIYISLPFIFPGEIKKTTDKVTEILGVSPNIIYPKHFDFLSPNTLYDNIAELKIDEFMTCDDNYKDSYLGMTFEHISLIKGNNLLEPYSKINGNNYNKLT